MNCLRPLEQWGRVFEYRRHHHHHYFYYYYYYNKNNNLNSLIHILIPLIHNKEPG
jgi:hypothetical protein